jgi:putative transposase
MNIRSRKTVHHESGEYALKEVSFVTICILNKYCFLGKVVNTAVELSELGEAVEAAILHIKSQIPGIIINYIVMPNHVHILFDFSCDMEISQEKKFTISSVVRNFKSFTTREYNKNHGKELIPLWQRGYYDHRIRDENEQKAVHDYINENPKRWAIDKFYVV